jgi:hypothetical protein
MVLLKSVFPLRAFVYYLSGVNTTHANGWSPTQTRFQEGNRRSIYSGRFTLPHESQPLPITALEHFQANDPHGECVIMRDEKHSLKKKRKKKNLLPLALSQVKS